MLLAEQQGSDQGAFYQAKVIRERPYRAGALQVEGALLERGATMRPEARARYHRRFAEDQRSATTPRRTPGSSSTSAT